MKVIRIYNQHRRDCTCDLECENCGGKTTNYGAYDDRNYWDNVIPNQQCEDCGKSTNDINPRIKQNIATKYPEGFQI
jgi:hypothetical protein